MKQKINFIFIFIILYFIIVNHLNSEQWQKLFVENHNKIFSLGIDSSNFIIVGLDTLFYSSRDNFIHVIYLPNFSTEPVNKIKIINKNHIFLITNYIIYSKNRGGVWEGFGNVAKSDNPSSVTFKDSLYFISFYSDSSGGVYKGKDFKIEFEFEKTGSGLPLQNDSIKALDIVNKNDTLIVGLANGLYYSTNDGEQWLPFSEFDGLEVDHFVLNSKNDLYFIVAGTGEKSGIYKNNNLYFNDVLPLSDVTVDRKDNVLISSSIRGRGVFFTSDDGQNWTEFYDGLDSSEVTAIIVDTAGIAYAGTNRNGLYRTQLYPTAVNDTKIFSNNILIIPNPFTQTTTIKYSLPNTG